MKRLSIHIFNLFLVFSLIFVAKALAVPYFQNPSFEDDLNFWSHNGTVSVITGDNYVPLAKDGEHMVLLSKPGNAGGGALSSNWISQTIDAFTGSISFWYKLYTSEKRGRLGYDKPSFQVKINDDIVLSVNSTDRTVYSNLGRQGLMFYRYSDWLSFTYDVSSFSAPITITIYAGNTCDNLFNSWAYIDFFSPGPPTSPGGGAPVPEPATGLLLLSAFPALYFWRKKRS